MKPYYSIAELAHLLEDDDARVADALVACGVSLIYEGKQADLSRWKRIQPRRFSSGGVETIYIMPGSEPFPSPEAVVVSAEALPNSWINYIKAIDGNKILSDSKEATASVSENTLLCTIAALLANWPGGKRPTGKDLERAAAAVGVSISDDSLRKAMSAALQISTIQMP